MMDLAGVALAGVGALGVAGQSICVRIGTEDGTPTDALFVVVLINLFLIGPISLVVGYPSYGLTPLSVLAFAVSGTVAITLGRVFLFAGIQRIGASRADSLKASMPLHSTVIAVVVLGETLTAQHLLGIVLMVVGVGLVSWESSRSSLAAENVPARWLLLPLIAAVLFAIEPTLAKIGFAEGTPVIVGLGINVTAGALAFTAYLAWRDRIPTLDRLGGDLRWYVGAGVVGALSMVCYYAALAVAPVAIVVPIIQASPLFVALISFGFLQRLERVTPRLVASSAVVVAGAILVTLAS